MKKLMRGKMEFYLQSIAISMIFVAISLLAFMAKLIFIFNKFLSLLDEFIHSKTKSKNEY